MEVLYMSAKSREQLTAVFPFTGNYHEDSNILIDVVGVVNLNPREYDEEGNIIEEKEPVWSDFLFNVVLVTGKYKPLFSGFKQETPKTPFRKFFL